MKVLKVNKPVRGSDLVMATEVRVPQEHSDRVFEYMLSNNIRNLFLGEDRNGFDVYSIVNKIEAKAVQSYVDDLVSGKPMIGMFRKQKE